MHHKYDLLKILLKLKVEIRVEENQENQEIQKIKKDQPQIIENLNKSDICTKQNIYQ